MKRFIFQITFIFNKSHRSKAVATHAECDRDIKQGTSGLVVLYNWENNGI